MRYVLINHETTKAVAVIEGSSFFVKGKGEVIKRTMSADEGRLYRATTNVINAGGAVLPEGCLYQIPLHEVEGWCPGWAQKLGTLIGYVYLPGNCPEGTLTLHTVWAK